MKLIHCMDNNQGFLGLSFKEAGHMSDRAVVRILFNNELAAQEFYRSAYNDAMLFRSFEDVKAGNEGAVHSLDYETRIDVEQGVDSALGILVSCEVLGQDDRIQAREDWGLNHVELEPLHSLAPMRG